MTTAIIESDSTSVTGCFEPHTGTSVAQMFRYVHLSSDRQIFTSFSIVGESIHYEESLNFLKYRKSNVTIEISRNNRITGVLVRARRSYRLDLGHCKGNNSEEKIPPGVEKFSGRSK